MMNPMTLAIIGSTDEAVPTPDDTPAGVTLAMGILDRQLVVVTEVESHVGGKYNTALHVSVQVAEDVRSNLVLVHPDLRGLETEAGSCEFRGLSHGQMCDILATAIVSKLRSAHIATRSKTANPPDESWHQMCEDMRSVWREAMRMRRTMEGIE